MFLNTEILFEAIRVLCTQVGISQRLSGAWEKGHIFLGSWRISKYLRGARRKHLIWGSLGAMSKYKYIYFQGVGEVIFLFSRSKDSLCEGLTSNHH